MRDGKIKKAQIQLRNGKWKRISFYFVIRDETKEEIAFKWGYGYVRK
jgi:hypothetical protein